MSGITMSPQLRESPETANLSWAEAIEHATSAKANIVRIIDVPEKVL
jgi:hypothetical protein